MSRLSSHDRTVTIANSAEVLEVICDHASVTPSSTTINTISDHKTEDDEKNKIIICPCKATIDAEREKKHAEEINKLLNEKEIEMEEKFQERIKQEMEHLKDRFDFILHHEQIRTSYMLREAYRERKEKISALQTQLECKNMAGLMYVLCTERHKSKLEAMKLTEEYTNYIKALHNILTESQSLIMRLSRGYKTAARVDYEWRQKMKKVIKHFQYFVHNFIGGTPEAQQYLFDIPALLRTEAPLEDNPHEDPCEDEEVPVKEGLEPALLEVIIASLII
ncbi:unnamed protein product [Euphydryas editha]|uniref:Uncharacterized protein n=1 Tax=Euphydryas editha TaxID=104508 RepID=A0AAU9UCM9_EUPED|nr:unnamed protein product [Euphydryas editha]